MVRLLLKDITQLLKNRSNVRNISIIGMPDDEIEALSDGLLNSSGISVADNYPPYAPWVECNPRELYVDPAACASLYATMGDKSVNADDLSNQYIVNVIHNNNPNGMHEIGIADGVIIVVDPNQDVNANMQTFIQNAINEKLKIVLFINNVDVNLLTVTESNVECIYRDLGETIDKMKSLIHQHTNDELYAVDVMRNIIFGCAKKGWAFSLHSFADIYSETFSKLDTKTLAAKLWGDHYYSFTDRKWSKTKKNDTYERSFVRFILEPIHKLYQAIANNNRAEVDNMLTKLRIHLPDYEKERSGEVLLRKIMSKWCPLSNCILPVIITHLPSPIVAQRYRFDVIYQGNDQDIIDAIRNGQESGKFVMQITKTLWTNDQRGRYAFGRILSGKLMKGDKVRCITDRGTFLKKKVEKILFLSGRYVDEVTETFSGSVCALCGFDSYINGVATLTDD